MSFLQNLPYNISNLPAFSPLTITTPISTLLTHLTTRPVHPTYYPFLRFGVLHAFRVAFIWAGLTKGKDRRGVGRLGDLFGYLCVAWGGGTITSLLLSQSPAWLISPTPWQIYPLIYLLLIPTGISNLITSHTPSLLLTTISSLIDAIIVGTTITSIPALLSTSTNPSLNGLWTRVLLSGIRVSGGGWFVQTLGLDQAEWVLGVPGFMKGLAGGVDLWLGMAMGLMHAVLGGHEETQGITNVLGGIFGVREKGLDADGKGGILDGDLARVAVVGLLFTVLWIHRVSLSGTNGARILGRVKKAKKVVRTTELRIMEKSEIATPVRATRAKTPTKGQSQAGDTPGKKEPATGTPAKIAKLPIASGEGTTTTPRKSPRAKSRS